MKTEVIRSENGVVMVAALLVLMLLSFVAITLTDTTIFEKKMVRSESIFKKAFYSAESAAFEGAQKLDNEVIPEELLAPLVAENYQTGERRVLIETDEDEPRNLLATLELYEDASDPTDTADITLEFMEKNLLGEPSEQDQESYRLMLQPPIESGDSLALGQSRLYTYESYGLSESLGGRSLVRVGYKKRF